MERGHIVDNRVIIQVVLICGAILALLLLAFDAILFRIFPAPGAFSKGVKTGLSLLVFWVVVTSGLRSIHRLRRGIPGIKLLLSGVIMAVLGTLFHQLLLQFLDWLKVSWSPDPNYRTFLFYAVGGFIAAVISLINLRVKNRKLGNLLEILFIALIAFLFFYYTK